MVSDHVELADVGVDALLAGRNNLVWGWGLESACLGFVFSVSRSVWRVLDSKLRVESL